MESDDPNQWRDYVEHVADQILLRAGTPPQADHRRIKRRVRTPAVDKACPQYQHLCRLVRRALLVGTRRDLADVTGRPMADDDPLFSLASTKPVGRPTCITLDDLIRAFEADPGRAGSSAKVAMEYAMVFRAMREVIGGDKDVNGITRDDFRRLRDLFLALPPNATKRFPQLTLTEAAERAATAKLTPLNPKTVNTHVGKVATLFNWAVREDFVRRNLAKGLQVKNAAEAQRDREPFTIEHLQAIFSAPLYTGCRDDERNYAKPGPNRPRRCRFWAPLLALFLGVRANECCQLRVDDVAEQDGYPVLVTRKSNFTQRLKTRAARRIVPLHPEIVRMGFLGFVARARAAGQERLFPEMKLNSKGLYSDQLIDWFLGFLDHCGVQERSFHCFRHTWADRMRAAGVPEDRRKELGGWANTSVGARYGLGSPTSMLAADIASITYPGLDLSHL